MLTTSTTPSTRSFFFFFNDTATTEIYTLSLHDALPIWQVAEGTRQRTAFMAEELGVDQGLGQRAAVDGDKGATAARAQAVDVAGHHFLVCAPVPQDEDARPPGGPPSPGL